MTPPDDLARVIAETRANIAARTRGQRSVTMLSTDVLMLLDIIAHRHGLARAAVIERDARIRELEANLAAATRRAYRPRHP